MAQCWFMYMVFIKNNNNGDISGIPSGGDNGNDDGDMKEEILLHPDQKIRAQQGKIEGMVHGLPPKLKNQILGGKFNKLQDLQSRLIN